MRKIVQDVREFHLKMGLCDDPHGPTRFLNPEMNELSLKRLREEVDEYEAALTLEEKVDALIDLIYIAAGRLEHHNIHPEVAQRAWDRVHTANMQKRRAVSDAESKHGTQLDIVKPEGWTAPTFTDLLEFNNYLRDLENQLVHGQL